MESGKRLPFVVFCSEASVVSLLPWCPGEYIVGYGLGERDKSAPLWKVDVRSGNLRYVGTLHEIIAAERAQKTEDSQRVPLCLNGKTPILDDGRDGD